MNGNIGIYFLTRLKTKFIRDYYLKKYGLDATVKRFNSYGGKKLIETQKAHQLIYQAIKKNEPFMAGRFGSIELLVSLEEYLGIIGNEEYKMKALENNAGFFPSNKDQHKKFSDIMLESMKKCDLQGIWYLLYEDYTIKKILPSVTNIIEARYLEPWFYKENPWTAALENKKVLVIHPFENTIKSQYKKRKYIFPNNEKYLPKFELKTLRAIQSAAGTRDTRFKTWFEALNYMYEEALKIDFDVAIIGCGAYGYPLAAKLKCAGKQAIHLGGVVQAMFGIKGRRWIEDVNPIVRNMYNEYWVYPSEDETPKSANSVEGGCYW